MKFSLRCSKRFSRWRSGQLWAINTSRHRINPASQEVLLHHSSSYYAGPRDKTVLCTEFDRIFVEEVIDHALTNWVLPLHLTPGKDGSLQCCRDYEKLNTVQLCSYCKVCTRTNWSTAFWSQQYFPHCRISVNTGSLKANNVTGTRQWISSWTGHTVSAFYLRK